MAQSVNKNNIEVGKLVYYSGKTYKVDSFTNTHCTITIPGTTPNSLYYPHNTNYTDYTTYTVPYTSPLLTYL